MKPRSIYFGACLDPFGRPLGAYKIGCSENPEQRAKSIGSNLPFTVELMGAVPGGFFMETLVHLYLKDHRIRGEYFLMNAATDKFVRDAIGRGECFAFIEDGGFPAYFSKDEAPKVRDAFLRYHDVSMQEARLFLGLPPSKSDTGAQCTRVIAAAAIIAQRRRPAQYVRFAIDVMRGLMGEIHWSRRPEELAPPDEKAAA